MNTICITGRMAQNAEVRQTPTGTSVTQFAVAVERKYQKPGEERQADFIDCIAWRNTAEFIGQYFAKGMPIAITGELQTRSYKDRNGNKRKAVEVLVEHADFCGGRKDPAAEPPAGADFDEITLDDDLPF